MKSHQLCLKECSFNQCEPGGKKCICITAIPNENRQLLHRSDSIHSSKMFDKQIDTMNGAYTPGITIINVKIDLTHSIITDIAELTSSGKLSVQQSQVIHLLTAL